MKKTDYRVERDSIGVKDIPEDVYYGVQSLRAAENFHITGLNMHPEIINSLAYIKKAAAITNCEVGLLEKKKAQAIVQACDEIVSGKFHNEFIVDPVQGGAGTSLNMNANEVIANRAIEILGGKKGDYTIINPNDDVNCGQSTNDVIPTAGKMTSLRLLQNLKKQLLRLYDALNEKAAEFDHIIKMGRTQMQDAVPIRLGQEFKAYSVAIMRDIHRMDKAMDEMRTLNMGGTAIGTGINADEGYLRRIVPNLTEISGMDFIQAFDLIDSTQNLDPFVAVSGAVKACAVTLSKMSNDLRLMSSGPRTGFGEINLPANFNQAFESTNGDGCIFKDEYGSSFTVSGGHNMGMTLADEYDMDIQNHPSVAYKAKGDDWYVISYLENDRTYYKKCFINGEYWNTWYFDYPSWLADSYNNKCAVIESTFTPGWKSGRAFY